MDDDDFGDDGMGPEERGELIDLKLLNVARIHRARLCSTMTRRAQLEAYCRD